MPTQPIASVLVVGLLILTGCLGTPASDSEHDDPPGTVGLTVEGSVRVVGTLAREPGIVQAPDGTLFVTGFRYSQLDDNRAPSLHDPPKLWRSDDGGEIWRQVDVGTVADGAIGNSDVDLAVGPDGAIYLAAMTYTRIHPAVFAEGDSIAVGVSRDGGDSWRWNFVSVHRGNDRPWIEIAPDGTAHVIWNYGEGVRHATSTDHGETWIEGPSVHPRGGSSFLAIGPGGELAVRVAPGSRSGYIWDAEVDGIATSTDGGASWAFEDVPGDRSQDDVPRWVEPIAFGDDGTLFSAWSEGDTMVLGQTGPGDEQWQMQTLAALDNQTAFYPYMATNGQDLAISWFTRSDGLVTAHVALVKDATRQFQVALVDFPVDAGGSTGGEYFPVAFLADGTVGAVTTIQNGGPNGDEDGFEFWSLSVAAEEHAGTRS